MEEKNESKVVKTVPLKKKEEPQKLSYEELNNACAEMSQQLQNQSAYIQKMHRSMQEMDAMLQSKRLDYLFKVVEISVNPQFTFSESFIYDCIKEIQDSLTIPEQKEKTADKKK